MVTGQHYWTHKGHTYGQCHTRDDSDYLFVNIPKNSSSWTQTLVAHWCLWEPHNYYDQPELLDKIALVTLRDPVNRWISGIAEYITLYHPRLECSEINATMLDWIFDRVAFDDHTERQTLFIENLNLDKIVWFWCDQDYNANFSNFLLSVGELNETYVMSAPINESKTNSKKIIITEFFKNHLKNSTYLNKLQQYYRSDYQLIKSVNFTKK